MTEYELLSLVRIAVNAVYVLALVFAMSNFKCRTRTVRIAYAAILAASSVGCAGVYLLFGRERMMQLFALFVAIPCLAVLLLLSKDRFLALFFNFFTAVNALYLVSIIGLTVSNNESLWLDILIRAILYSIILYLFYHYFSAPYHFLAEHMSKSWWVISVIPFLFFALVMFLGLYPGLNHNNFPTVLIIYVILGFVYVVIYQIFQNTYTLLRSNELSRILEIQLAMHRQNEDRIRFLRHDMRHHMRSISALLKENKVTEALGYIEQIDPSILQIKAARWCENDTVNAMLSYYLSLASDENISIEARLELPEELPVDAAEFTTVFANALENAVTACQRQPEGQERRLLLNAVSSPQLAIEISNTFDGKVRFSPDSLPLTAEKGHGVGTKSIMDFAKNHNAACQFFVRDAMFCMQLIMDAAPFGNQPAGKKRFSHHKGLR